MSKVGVVVGRFQVDELHAGHRHILGHAAINSDRLVVVIGEGPLPTTANNPLSYRMRRAMVEQEAQYLVGMGDVHAVDISKLKDIGNNELWSQNLDALIEKSLDNGDECVLYCSRDSFRPHYTGKFPIEELPPVTHSISASERRAEIGSWNFQPDSLRFRQGVIWANAQKFPTVYSCVDAAVIKWSGGSPHLLMIKKTFSDDYMLPGGFAELGSTDEDDAAREVLEETNIVAVNPRFLASFTQDDWRYRSEVDEIRTRLYVFDYESGEPEGLDDAAWAGWVNIFDLKLDDVHPCHLLLVQKLLSSSDNWN